MVTDWNADSTKILRDVGSFLTVRRKVKYTNSLDDFIRYQGHQAHVTCLALLPDSRLATGWISHYLSCISLWHFSNQWMGEENRIYIPLHLNMTGLWTRRSLFGNQSRCSSSREWWEGECQVKVQSRRSGMSDNLPETMPMPCAVPTLIASTNKRTNLRTLLFLPDPLTILPIAYSFTDWFSRLCRLTHAHLLIYLSRQSAVSVRYHSDAEGP